MAWPNQSSGPLSMFLLLAFLAILPQVFCTGRKPGVHLEYVCTEPHNVPKEEKTIPVIMMHGLSDVKETWNGIYENVSSLTNRKVCIYDARNHGGSSWNNTLSVDAMTEDLESFMSMMKMERAFLVGHSMGGLTAMKMALTNPNKVEGIFVEDVGIEPPVGILTFIGYVVRKLQQSLTAIPEGADEFTAKTAVLNYMTKAIRIKLPNDNYFKVAPLHLQNGVWKWKTNFEVIENILDNTHLFFSKLEGQYEGKALFIYGKSSPFEVWRQEEKIRKLFPKVTFVGIEGGDHLLHFFRPEFVEELIEFLT